MKGLVTASSILGSFGQSHVPPDGSVVKWLIENLLYLLHVNHEVDVIGSIPFGLKLG